MLSAFAYTLRNLRTNFFQTLLSVLGVIIGVGALVAMLSMIDGLEAYARETISEKSSLENISIRSNTGTTIDGIYVERDTIAIIDEAVMKELLDSLPYDAVGSLLYDNSTIAYTADSLKMGVRYRAGSLPMLSPVPDSLILHGSMFTEADAAAKAKKAFINETLARRLIGDDDLLINALGQPVFLLGDTLSVCGIYAEKKPDQERLGLFMPLSTLSNMNDAPTPYPELTLALTDVHQVLDAQKFSEAWLARHFADIPNAMKSRAQVNYLKDLAEGVLVFRLVMGFLIGIAVVVGGVGVMNVLLMSISERTPEIGIRKAVGASRKKIIRQFLAESVAVSLIGCIFGLLLGMAVAAIAAPVLNYFVEDLQFRAIFSLNTLLTVGVVALVIGIVFGTYPARKAAALDPVVAIRR